MRTNFWNATPTPADMLAHDYLVVAPGYPGLGSPMPYPHPVGTHTTRSVLDAVRATPSLPEPRTASWRDTETAMP